nr:hypothetical protein CFP56_52094 [Quercus suber]
MSKRKVPPILILYFNNIESIVQKSGLKFDVVHRYRELNRCVDRMACLGHRLQCTKVKLWTESLPSGLMRCLEAKLLPNTAERVLKEKVSKRDEPKEKHVTYNKLKAIDTNALVILNLVAAACHAMSKGAAVKFTFIQQNNVIIQKVSRTRSFP